MVTHRQSACRIIAQTLFVSHSTMAAVEHHHRLLWVAGSIKDPETVGE